MTKWLACEVVVELLRHGGITIEHFLPMRTLFQLVRHILESTMSKGYCHKKPRGPGVALCSGSPVLVMLARDAKVSM